MFGSQTHKGMYHESKKKEGSFGNFKIKFTDVLDVSKDHFYLFNFPHWKTVTSALSFAIIAPFMAYHSMSEITKGWINSLFMYLGLT